jgi:hypothetical protein
VDREAQAPPRRRDRGFTDEQIFEILRAGEAGGASAAELCAAHEVAFPTYCLWKSRYRHLSLPELMALRRSERRKTMIRRAGLVTTLALSAGLGLFVLSGWTTAPASAADGGAGNRPVAQNVVVPVVPESDAGAAPAPPPAPVTAAASVAVETLPPPPAAQGFAVQVSAEPDAREARTIVDQLAAAGYSAYVLPATFGELELFRVRLGPFGTWREAQEVVRRLEEEGYDGPWIANP